MHRRAAGIFVVLLIMTIGFRMAGQTGATIPSPDTSKAVDPNSGKELYTAYCALCHGADGKGGGPFSPQLKVAPPDLTQLLKENHGTYPEMRVRESVDGEFGKPSHGSAEMPIWGPVFRSMAHGRRDSAQVRINSLVKYIESIQAK